MATLVDGGGSLRRALLGGNLTAAAVNNGWTGIVIGLRAGRGPHSRAGADAAAHRERNVGQRDGPMQLQGVWVRPGNWLLADADGILVMAHPLD